MKTLTTTYLVFLVSIIFAQEFQYKPVQHFVFPKVKLSNSDKPMPSEIVRVQFQKYIFNYAYSACYDTEYNLPLWVSHHINSSLLEEKFKTRPSGYPKDPQYPNLKGNALQSSGYDHGHLAPAADFKWSKEAYLQSFLMTNMAPQHGCLNQKGWCHLEGTVRKWVEDNPNLDLYIVSGAIINEFIDTLCLSKDIQIFVPRYFYKTILIIEPNEEPKTIGYIIPNEDVSTFDIQLFQTSVSELEKLTNLDFFSFLPREIQNEIEPKIPNVPYYSTVISCPDKACESVYSGNRVSPENRTRMNCD